MNDYTERTFDTAEERNAYYSEIRCNNYNESTGTLNEIDGYNCPKCKNRGNFLEAQKTEFGYTQDVSRPCSCRKIRACIAKMKRSGLEDVINKYKFDSFDAVEEWQKIIKAAAMRFVDDNENTMFFIGGQSGCVDSETEYFNGTEWKSIAEYGADNVLTYDAESGRAVLDYPLRYIKKPEGTMYQVSTIRGSIDMCLSDDHSFAYITSKGHMQKKQFSEVVRLHNENVQGFYGKIETAFNYSGDGIELSDNDIRIMCAVMADGSFTDGLNRCTVRVKKERKKKRMREMLKNRDYKEYICKEGFSQFCFIAPRREKEYTSYWYGCNNHQLSIIADEVFYWDGSKDEKGRQAFYTTSKKSADFVQFAISATGSRSTIGIDKREGKAICYNVNKIKGNSTVSMVSTGGATKADIKQTKTKDGMQYCFTVKTGYLVLRRNNRIFVTGNCGKTHLCTAMSAEYLRQNKAVKYMLWADEVTALKTVINDYDAYSRMMRDIKHCEVLYIDDFFKTGNKDGAAVMPTASDIRIAYEIINYRYINKGLTTIISSERTINDLIEIDEALGGRIAQYTMPNGYGYSIRKDRAKNYRLKYAAEL